MKKILLLPLLFLLAVSVKAGTLNSDLFEINEEEIMAQVSELAVLENYISAHDGVTFSEVMNIVGEGDLNLSKNMLDNFASTLEKHPVAGIPSFLWGCVLGPVGIAIVHFDAEDKAQTRKAIYGCVALGGVYALLIAASYIFAFSAYPW